MKKERKDIRDIASFDQYSIFGKRCLVTDHYINIESATREGLYVYDIRHDDDNWGTPVTIENKVCVNRMGSLIVDEPITYVDEHYRWIDLEEGDDDQVIKLNDQICLSDYMVAKMADWNGHWKIPQSAIKIDPSRINESSSDELHVYIVRDDSRNDEGNASMMKFVERSLEKEYPSCFITTTMNKRNPSSFEELTALIQAVKDSDLVIFPNKINRSASYITALISEICNVMCNIPNMTISDLNNKILDRDFVFIDKNGESYPLFSEGDYDERHFDTVSLSSLVSENDNVKFSCRIKGTDNVIRNDVLFDYVESRSRGVGNCIWFKLNDTLISLQVNSTDAKNRFDLLTLDFSGSDNNN